MKKDVLYIIAICACLICIFKMHTSNRRINQIHEHNIEALSDTVSYYRGRNNVEVAEKAILQGKFDDLKKTNEDLYDMIKSMKVKKPEQTVKVETVIKYEPSDTTFIREKTDSIYRFDFSDKWRKLDGSIRLKQDSIKFNIDNDAVYSDISIAVKDGVVYAASSNPYIKFNDIKGITLPKQKSKRFGVGPYVGIEYDFAQKEWNVSAGLSFSYHLFEF